METPRRSPGSGALRCCTDVRSTIPSGTAYATEPDHRLGAHAKTARLVLGIAELALFGDVVGAARWSAGVIIVLAPGPHRLPPTSKEHGVVLRPAQRPAARHTLVVLRVVQHDACRVAGCVQPKCSRLRSGLLLCGRGVRVDPRHACQSSYLPSQLPVLVQQGGVCATACRGRGRHSWARRRAARGKQPGAFRAGMS